MSKKKKARKKSPFPRHQKKKARKKSPFPRHQKIRQGGQSFEVDAYNSPFKHFIMPLRHGRTDKVYRGVTLCWVEILAPGPSGARVGVKTWVPLQLPQMTPRQFRADFFNWDGSLDYESIRGLFLNSSLALYAHLILVQGIYLIKTEIGRKRAAKKVLKKSGGFKSHAKKHRKPNRKKTVRRRNKTSKRKRAR